MKQLIHLFKQNPVVISVIAIAAIWGVPQFLGLHDEVSMEAMVHEVVIPQLQSVHIPQDSLVIPQTEIEELTTGMSLEMTEFIARHDVYQEYLDLLFSHMGELLVTISILYGAKKAKQ